jgi:hypothetical protein
MSLEFKVRVQQGLVPGMSIMSAMGEREQIQTTAAGEDLTRMNELAVAPTSHLLVPTPSFQGEGMSFKSESTEDTPAGAGAAEVTIEYIDAAGREQTEVKPTNGTTLVALTATDIRFVNDFYVSALGATNTTGVATGRIFIHKTGTAGLVYNMIAAGGNKSLVPHRMVPAGKKLLLQHSVKSEKSGAKRCTVRLRSDCTPSGVRQAGVFLFKSTGMFDGSGVPFELGDTIPALSVVKASAWASAQPAEAAITWWGYLANV